MLRGVAALYFSAAIRRQVRVPAYNHTRSDGPFNPCPICLPLMSREDLIALVSDLQMQIRDLNDPDQNHHAPSKKRPGRP